MDDSLPSCRASTLGDALTAAAPLTVRFVVGCKGDVTVIALHVLIGPRAFHPLHAGAMIGCVLERGDGMNCCGGLDGARLGGRRLAACVDRHKVIARERSDANATVRRLCRL